MARGIDWTTRRRESGAATTLLVLGLSVLLICFGFWYVQNLAQVEEKGGVLQSAADAAALAGAQSIVSGSPEWVRELVNGNAVLRGGLGQSVANEFARRNNSTLVFYQYHAGQDLIILRIRSMEPLVTGRHEEAEARARVGFRAGACVLSSELPRPTPTRSWSYPEAGTPTPAPLDYDGLARCGDLTVPVRVSGVNRRVSVSLRDDEIKSLFAPSLET